MTIDIDVALSGYQREFVRELLTGNVRFLILGGRAIRAYGLDRATHDLDLFIDRSTKNIECLLPIISKRFRNHPVDLTAEWLSLPEKRVALPGGQIHEIDILTSCGSLDFEASSINRLEVESDSLILPVLGLRELIYSKLASADRSEDPHAVVRDISDLGLLLELWQRRHNDVLQTDAPDSQD